MVRRVLVLLVAFALIVVALVRDAQAATCADHPNQASAQRAKDTRDADGDGIYCEALPCPCLKPGQEEPSSPGPSPRPRPQPEPKRAQTIRSIITAVIDGDTIRVRPLEETRRSVYTVRLLGIDTPERGRCGAAEATANMRRVGRPGRRVVLTTDPTQASFDRYGRLLAYARVPAGTLQLFQLNAGWAKVFVFGRAFRRVGSFTATQNRARAARRGVWGICGGSFQRPA